MKKEIFQKNLTKIVYFIMLTFFLPVLFSVIFIGNNMNYYEGVKIVTLLPNFVLFFISVLLIILINILYKKTENIEINKKNDKIIHLFLIISFIVIYFVNVKISLETAFQLPWDIMVVREYAYAISQGKNLGYQVYLSMNTNNIPISCILGVLYKIISNVPFYPYIPDFFWIQINCVFFSIGGYFSCLTVKKVTKKIAPIILVFLFYLFIVALSAWKLAPYTDTYGLIFPIISIYFYVSYLEADERRKKIIFLILSVIIASIGGFIKPNLNLILIAIICSEIIRLISHLKDNMVYFIIIIATSVLMLVSFSLLNDYLIKRIGLDFNPEIETTWHHYFYMGLNEETTGGYNSNDASLIGQYQDNAEERREVQIELALERLQERGFVDSIYFYLRKMTMVFNDGTFGWFVEIWIHDYYPTLASNTKITDFLRNIYWDGSYVDLYKTICQTIWITVLIGIPGICFHKYKNKENYLIFVISFIGIFLYQMIFEARARYIFVFMPLILSISSIGYFNFFKWITKD